MAIPRKIWTDTKTGLIWIYDLHVLGPWHIVKKSEFEIDIEGKWRLATITDIETVLDRTNYNPAVKEDCPFPSVSIWLNNEYSKAPKYTAWAVDLIKGTMYIRDKSNQKNALFVRI